MDHWQSATDSNRFIYEVIGVIFCNHPNLLEFFFEGRCPRIRFQAMEVHRHAACFPSDEKQLIRVSLDVWSGSGNAKVWQLLETVDSGNLGNVLEALGKLRGRSRAN
ncbi:MAG: hypothetical protein IPJ71_19040 [Bdellovibrionales bacterium]|nr:hypothetical protein [Bdellovibrionales bacterium]